MPKQREKAILKKVTLKTVYLLALDKKKFLNALLKNPEKALYRAGLILSPGDFKKLNRLVKSKRGKALPGMLARRYKIKGSDLSRFLLTCGNVPAVAKPWPPPPWTLTAR